ncbi:hypothetical protein CAPN001_05780 [Capnocytophaga stomatis]|nr:hypothetical protein CAPN001_05780 [Capnocytophaga stomatis]GIM49027.1 hypothetical protein CAPN003_04790 [Capnocytophaga stomatis]
MAKNYHCGLRITADFAGFFGQFEATGEKVILDLSPLKNYPDLPELIIEDNFKIDEVVGVEVLYTLQKLTILNVKKVSKKLQIDVSQIPNLVDLRFDFYPCILGLGKAINLNRLHIWSYNKEDLTELKDLTLLTDLLLVRPSIQRLSGIENMTRLEKFEITYARKLEDISALKELQKKHIINHLALPQKFW